MRVTIYRSPIPAIAIVIATLLTSSPVNAAEGDKVEAVATIFGSFLAYSAECGFPMSRVEKVFDRYLDDKKVGPMEAARLRNVMMHFRGVMKGVAAVDGCPAAQEKINHWLGKP